MATVDQHGCDGCDREFTAAELYPVELPNGETTICCPDCREHAKEAAEKQAELVATRSCDGCGDAVASDALSEVLLPDGVTVSLCEACEAAAPDPTAETGASDRSDRASRSDRPGRSDPDDLPDPDDGGDVRNRCDRCREWMAAELWEVVTVDDRVEEFCDACKNLAIEDGVVKRVNLKRAEAREILDVEPDADQSAIRRAYLAQVKRAHPDRDTGSTLAFKRVQRAYDRLAEEE